MKNSIISGIVFIMCIFISTPTFAETYTSLNDAINGIWMKQYTDISSNVSNLIELDIQNFAQSVMNDEGLKHKYGIDFEEEAQMEINHYQMVNTPDIETAYKFFHLNISKYAVQYAEAGKIDYLLGEYWLVPKKAYRENQDVSWNLFDKNAETFANNELVELMVTNKPVIPFDMIDYVKDIDKIEALLEEAGAQDFIVFKVIDVNSVHTVLYFKYANGEYGILIRDADNNTNKPELEHLKVYDFSYILEKIGETQSMGIGGRTVSTKELLYEKNVYQEEAESLQQEGLLQGNENGLDLLKPLTRAEAVTLLIRAMGLEDQTANYTVSQFADIASDNWASPYAALAKEEGITNGISDTEFAPDDPVTADQFATFTLRAAGESNFDYTQGIQILIDRGIITEEESETMDLFTRGDMAKIIYEAREEGLL